MRAFKTLIVASFVLVALSCQQRKVKPSVDIIPEPLSIILTDEASFELNESTPIVIQDSSMLPAASLLQDILGQDVEISFQVKDTPAFVFELDNSLDSLSAEGYVISVSKQQVNIKSSGPQGLFYAVETIRQMLPADVQAQSGDEYITACRIVDSPRFAWRGLHLDVSRHFMPKEFIKKYIDYLAMHKLNVFHWHLVDGIGWRIEIKSHPELTDIGAWRKVKPNVQPWQEFEVWREGDDEPKYGGYYTQDEVREIVAYAQERYITVLPEIELPGHSEVVFQCYPQLACKNSKGGYVKNSGVYCASNPKGYQLLEDVLDEVLELFPSEYIHIGGDEVDKKNWNQCPDCKRLMNKKDYDAHQLQSHFINHFDEYLKSKGRKLIGWHEILEGELSPSATIMYWGAEKAVEECLKNGHPTVLTTGSHLYFDHYQSLSKQEPKAFGGYAPLKKVYDYEPVPNGVDAKYADLVMGVQANIWTEYMPTEKHVEYMLFPRLAALSEIAWQQKGTKNWSRFRDKMDGMLQHYKVMDVNYAYSALRPEIQFDLMKETKQLKVSLETELHADIYFTIDGSEPKPESATLYCEPFMLDQSATIKAIAVKDGEVTGQVEVKEALLHKARGANVQLNSIPNEKYAAKGGYTLVDTDFGGDKWGNKKWIGVINQDFEAVISLDESTPVSQVIMSCIEETGPGIYFPTTIQVLTSEDGVNFSKVGQWATERTGDIPVTSEIYNEQFEINIETVNCKYIKVQATCQELKSGGAFLFVDELIVN